MRTLDKGTFGNTKACHILIERLNASNKKTQKMVLNIIQTYTNTLKHLNDIQDRTIRINMAKVYRKSSSLERYSTRFGHLYSEHHVC